MRICCATSGFSSMLSLTIRTAPLAARTTFSRIGPNCLHGPHHGAQKSTMTGWSNEASTTSAMKFAVVTSAIGAAAPPPLIKGSFAMRFSPRGCNAKHGGGDARWQALPPPPLSRRARGGPGQVEIDKVRPVPAPGDKAQQIGGRDRGGAGVVERMVVE